jgi:hypothetical protein
MIVTGHHAKRNGGHCGPNGGVLRPANGAIVFAAKRETRWSGCQDRPSLVDLFVKGRCGLLIHRPCTKGIASAWPGGLPTSISLTALLLSIWTGDGGFASWIWEECVDV